MPYNPLHHKYRPQTFAQLVGQDAIATTLTNAIHTERIAPAYMFTGPRGTGKTSSARILAKSLNCLSSDKPTSTPCGRCEVCLGINKGSALDVIEIDAASNTGVDNIREVIERAQFAPVQCRYKLYIIDEAHMLSSAAFNALLKTLEEPPNQVVFVLATTDPQRVLPTIISRCQRFDFRPIPLKPMLAHLSKIAQLESINISPEAITLVAQIANGGLRDAQSLLDQLSLLPDTITPEKVWDLVGAVPEQDLLAMLQAIRSNDSATVIELCRSLMNRGKEPVMVLQNLAGFYLNLLIAKTSPQNSAMVALTTATWEKLTAEATHWDVSTILQGQQHLKTSEVQIKNSTQSRLWLEITLLGLLPAAMATPEIKTPTPVLNVITPLQELGKQKEEKAEKQPVAVTEVEKVDQETARKLITDIYTDGSCIGNPGYGGWAFVAYFEDGDRYEKGDGGVPNTTNNRMEIQAAIAALKYLADSGQTESITLHTDSEYVLKGVSQWIKIWQKNGWKTKQNKPVSNQDLWEKLAQLNSDLVTWEYVEGHSGNEGNERCDTIAKAFAKGGNPLHDEPSKILSPSSEIKTNSSSLLEENGELSHTNAAIFSGKKEDDLTIFPNQANNENRKNLETPAFNHPNIEQPSTADLKGNSSNIPVSKEEKNTAVSQASAIIANQIPTHVVWKQVLENLQPQTSRILLSQHCTLLYYDGSVAYIKVASTALLKHAQPRKSNIEDAFEIVSQKKITVNLQVSDTIPNHTQLSSLNLEPSPVEEEEEEDWKLRADEEVSKEQGKTQNKLEDSFVASPEVTNVELKSPDLYTTKTEITNNNYTEDIVIPSQEDLEKQEEKVTEEEISSYPEVIEAPEDEQSDSEETFNAAQNFAQIFKGEVITLDKEFNYVEPQLQQPNNTAEESIAESVVEDSQEEDDFNDIPF